MKLVTFNIAISDGTLEQKKGYRRKINGEDFLFEKDFGGYIFHHAKTGCYVHSGYSFTRTIDEIKAKMKDKPDAFEISKNLIIKHGHKYPVN